MPDSEALKKRAAEYVVQQYIKSNMLIGLGTGSTVRYFVAQLARDYQNGVLRDIACVSTSEATTTQARELGLPLRTYGELLADGMLDIAVDGADNVNERKQLIKGGGGALTREKIVAYNSRSVVIIIDGSKYADEFRPGTAVPVEVLAIAEQAVARRLREVSAHGKALFSSVHLRRTRGAATGNAPSKPSTVGDDVYVTDNGNVILDAVLAVALSDAHIWEERINTIPGVVENGFFATKEVEVVVGKEEGVRLL